MEGNYVERLNSLKGEPGMKAYFRLINEKWQHAWSNRAFRKNLALEILLLALMMVATFYFFNYLQYRNNGVVLNDWVLKMLPATNVSAYIVFFMTSVITLFILRSAVNPDMVLTFLLAFVFLLATRIITISITNLLAPPDLIVLKDPIGSLLYHSRFVTRDLFYSGHTASLFLFYLCSMKKIDKYYILFATVSVGILLLVQHVHYTVDVAFAPFFAFGCFWLSKRIMRFQHAYINTYE